MRRGLGTAGWGFKKPGLNELVLAGGSFTEQAVPEDGEMARDIDDGIRVGRAADFAAVVVGVEATASIAALVDAEPSSCLSSV